MTTARALIEDTAKLLNIIGAGESLTSEDAQDGLNTLNQLLESLSIEENTIYAEVTEGFSLTPGTSSYTLGTGGTFNSSRPTKIKSSYVRVNNYDTEVVIVDQTGFGQIENKTQTGTPDRLYYDGGFPFITVNLYPVPSVASTLFLNSEKPLTSIATLDTAISLPPGYERALKYNLAIDWAPYFEKEPSNDVKRIAARSLSSLKSANAYNEDVRLSVDDALLSMSAPSGTNINRI